jgi:DNA-binding MarR family transcriptional regulator
MEPNYTALMPQQGRTLPTVDLSMLLNQAAYAVTVRLGAALAEIDVSFKTYCVLKKGVEGDFTQAQLAERAWMDKTTMVNVLDDMERSGLASRTMSPTDRRVRIVAITAKGRSLLNKADAIAPCPAPADRNSSPSSPPWWTARSPPHSTWRSNSAVPGAPRADCSGSPAFSLTTPTSRPYLTSSWTESTRGAGCGATDAGIPLVRRRMHAVVTGCRAL